MTDEGCYVYLLIYTPFLLVDFITTILTVVWYIYLLIYYQLFSFPFSLLYYYDFYIHFDVLK
jgi:flagellar biosynthesis protein FliP